MESLTQSLTLLRQTRQNVLNLISGYTPEQLNKIPDGYANNLAWNLGHLVVTQQLLCYGRSGLALKVEEDMLARYRKGTRPEAAIEGMEIGRLKHLMTDLVDRMEADLNAGLFKEYNRYETSYGFVLENIEDGLNFNNVHEGMHLGYMMAMRKYV